MYSIRFSTGASLRCCHLQENIVGETILRRHRFQRSALRNIKTLINLIALSAAAFGGGGENLFVDEFALGAAVVDEHPCREGAVGVLIALNT
jgi:hypothetical protein